jgi:hypothetical protein
MDPKTSIAAAADFQTPHFGDHPDCAKGLPGSAGPGTSIVTKLR